MDENNPQLYADFKVVTSSNKKLEAKYSFRSPKKSDFWLLLLIGASYKVKLPHFEISVKLWVFILYIYVKRKYLLTLFCEFFSFLGPKN
jgi:hypothetical protein